MKILRGNKGQTIIEAIIALSLLTTGFLGMVGLLSRSLFLNRVTSDELTATYLASEGVELAKNIIDHDVYAHLAVPPQGAGWGTSFGIGGDFQFDTGTCTQGAAYCGQPPQSFDGAALKYDPATHLYGYGGPGATTNFVRRIRVTVPNAGEIVVNSIVTWSTGAITSQSVNIEDHFYNWHP